MPPDKSSFIHELHIHSLLRYHQDLHQEIKSEAFILFTIVVLSHHHHDLH